MSKENAISENATGENTSVFQVEVYKNGAGKCEAAVRNPASVVSLSGDWLPLQLEVPEGPAYVRVFVYPRWGNQVGRFVGKHDLVEDRSDHTKDWHWILLHNRVNDGNPVLWDTGSHTPACKLKITIKRD